MMPKTSKGQSKRNVSAFVVSATIEFVEGRRLELERQFGYVENQDNLYVFLRWDKDDRRLQSVKEGNKITEQNIICTPEVLLRSIQRLFPELEIEFKERQEAVTEET